MLIISSLLDKRMSDHGVSAKDVLDEILPKLLNSVHLYRSKGRLYSAIFTNKYVWTLRVNLELLDIQICKYKYKYWELPDLHIEKVECFKLSGEVLAYAKEKISSVVAPSYVS